MKVQKAAEKAKTDVKLFCDQHATQFLDLADSASIKYNRFMRTTDEDHKAAVDSFWRDLNHRGYIYEAKHEGWYCVSDETFYPASQVHMILDPSTGRKLHASIETGKEVQWTSETNYHFRLSAFRDQLLQHYEDNPTFIVPKERMNFIVSEVALGLSDLSVSRPASRLSWGIPVPDDDSQTIYVWLDALVNYITAAGYPRTDPQSADSLWPPECQVIGKDIIRFHCIYWPAFLMALDLPLPKQFLSHAHWTMNAEKMSKSLGNVVNPFFAMDRFGVDVIRYYMIRDGGIVDDAAYENSFIIGRYKKDLQGGFGNMISRIVRYKKWNVRQAVQETQVHAVSPPPWFAKWQEDINGLIQQCDALMQKPNPRDASARLIEIVYETNKMFQEHRPWALADSTDPHQRRQMNWVLFAAADALRVAAIAFQPIMPEKMKTALDMLGVVEERRTWECAEIGADTSYGTPFHDVGEKYNNLLFPPPTSGF
jgi:methionyl-tRNA synthetase